jgi:hypothetical protein
MAELVSCKNELHTMLPKQPSPPRSPSLDSFPSALPSRAGTPSTTSTEAEYRPRYTPHRHDEPINFFKIANRPVTIAFAVLFVLEIFSIIYWDMYDLSSILFLPPVVSICAVQWEKYRRRRHNRAIRDDEVDIGLMYEDEELEDGMNLYGVELRVDESPSLGKQQRLC